MSVGGGLEGRRAPEKERAPGLLIAWILLLHHSLTVNGRCIIQVMPDAGHVEVARLLVEHGGDLHHRNRRGRTPVMSCLSGMADRVLEQLLALGAGINDRDSQVSMCPGINDRDSQVGGSLPVLYASSCRCSAG